MKTAGQLKQKAESAYQSLVARGVIDESKLHIAHHDEMNSGKTEVKKPMIKYATIAIGLLFLYTGVQIDHQITMGVGAAIVAFGLLRGGVK